MVFVDGTLDLCVLSCLSIALPNSTCSFGTVRNVIWFRVTIIVWMNVSLSAGNPRDPFLDFIYMVVLHCLLMHLPRHTFCPYLWIVFVKSSLSVSRHDIDVVMLCCASTFGSSVVMRIQSFDISTERSISFGLSPCLLTADCSSSACQSTHSKYCFCPLLSFQRLLPLSCFLLCWLTREYSLMQCKIITLRDPAAYLSYSADPLLFLPDSNLIPFSISKPIHCSRLVACNWCWVLPANQIFDKLWCLLPLPWSFPLYIPTFHSACPCLRALPSNPTAVSRSVLCAEVAVHTHSKKCQFLDALPGNPFTPVDHALFGSTVLALLFWMLDLLVEIWAFLPVLSSISGDWPPWSILAVLFWNRCKVQIVPCIAELLQMLGLAFLWMLILVSTSLALSRFLPAPGFYEGCVPVHVQESRREG